MTQKSRVVVPRFRSWWRLLIVEYVLRSPSSDMVSLWPAAVGFLFVSSRVLCYVMVVLGSSGNLLVYVWHLFRWAFVLPESFDTCILFQLMDDTPAHLSLGWGAPSSKKNLVAHTNLILIHHLKYLSIGLGWGAPSSKKIW
jgi:hypothetical protein